MIRLAFLTMAALALLLPACSSDELDESEVTLGGFQIADKEDPGVLEAAQFAVDAQSKASGETLILHHVLKAYQQVVSGLNYRLILQVRADDVSRLADVEVYRNLDGKLSLTAWDWE